MSNKNCTYTFLDGQGRTQTIMGLSSMKAFLVDGGLDLFYPGGRFPWLSTESAIGSVADDVSNSALKIDASAQDLDAMFDDVLAEEMTKDEAAKPAPQSKPKTSKPRSTASNPRGTAVKPQRTAGQAATSAAKNTASALANAIDGLGALFGGGGKLNSGLSFDEETYVKAKPLFQAAIANMGEAGQDLREAMRAVVRMVLDKFGAQAAQNMKPYVVRFVSDMQNQDAPSAQENDNVPSANASVEPDRQEPAPESAMGDAVQADAAGSAGEAGGVGGQAAGGGRRGQPRGDGVPAGGAATDGNRGDFIVPGGDAAVDAARVASGADFSERGGDIGVDGVSVDPIPAEQVVAAAEAGNDKLVKLERQRAAEKVAVVSGDLDNIRATLPYLLEGQQEDVKKAEDRFAQPDGYGMLFTNGTGTGKTFTGLGAVKRFQRQGKISILIVVPDDKIAADWIESGEPLGLSITQLKDTQDAGQGIVITSYANLGENNALARRQWDMVVADEAHTLMQSADGKVTTYLANLRAITHHPDGATQRFTMLNRADIDAMKALNEQIDVNNKVMSDPDTMDVRVADLRAQNERLEAERSVLRKKLDAAKKAVQEEVNGMQGTQRARLLALSATPFAYEFTVDWANGYLFDYDEGQTSDRNEFRGYNQGSNRDRFFMTHFGYSMRTNRLTKPDPSKVDTGLMQRSFNGWLRKKGSLSARMLDVAADYDRRFVLVDSGIGNQIDDALNWLSEKSRSNKGYNGYAVLRQAIDEKFDHLSRRYLLEAIKATEVVPIVRQHMAMGCKVVVFHDYKKGGGFNPFKIERVNEPIGKEVSQESFESARRFNAALDEFNSKFKSLVNAPLGKMDSPIEVFSREFPNVLLINGDEKKKDLLERYKRFQDDASGPQVMLVQSAKNKGWSGHDTTGKHQRVLINLGQPTAPTLAIQQEGRIYRTGQVSDAIMRYLNTGTNWEKWTFATTIAGRAGTAENLGMGEQARALKDSFVAAFEESDAYPPGHEGEGKGGKDRDKLSNSAITVYDRAKTYYWATQKKTSKTKAQEGKDYFATPEPLGFKMAEWLGLRGGDDSLEPSAGHGAIARWLPENTSRTVIEPSMSLRARLAMAMDPGKDRIIDGTFEDHAIVNKYDGIVMNPPFGVGGKTAIEHLDKAAKHLRDGGRIVALIPTGPAADKRFDQWMYGESVRPTKPMAQHPQHGDIYRGDTVSFYDANGDSGSFVVEGGGRYEGTKTGYDYLMGKKGTGGLAPVSTITSVKPTGARTESYRASEGLYMVAEIKLPQVTFERAGTAVATRIVVLEKHSDPERFNLSARNIDLSGVTDINALFDRLEDMSLPPRSMTAEQEAAAPKAAPTEAPAKKQPKAANPDAVGTVERNGEPLIEHVTKKGKTLRGIVRTDMLREEAEKIDPYTFRKDGGWFIREEYLKPESGEDSAEVPAFSREKPKATSLSAAEANSIVGAITSRWDNAPDVVVVADMQDAAVPLRVREYDVEQRSLGAQGEPEGFWFGGKVYLVANSMGTPSDVMRVLFHEALGHYGLRGVFGDRLDAILQQIASLRRSEVEAKAKQYGLDMSIEAQRLQAAEEVLAVMAQTNPKLGFVKRAIGAIRSWLRRTMPVLFGQMELTDAEIIRDYILPARAFVERGATGKAAGGAAFSRNDSPIRAALGELIQAEAAWDAVRKGDPKNVSMQQFLELSDRSMTARKQATEQLASLPDDGFALQAAASGGRMLILTPSAQQPGRWQLTRFAPDGNPWGDTNFDTKQQAIREFLDEADLTTIVTGDGTAFSRSQDQTQTEAFKRWFGDWEAMRAQNRLDAMVPVKVRVPDEWRGLSHAELRSKMAEALDRMVRERMEIKHPEIGVIRVGRVGAKKSEGSARDPAKSLVVADLERTLSASVHARSEPSRGGDGADISGYSTLLTRVNVDDVDLVAAFTIRHQSDGRWYYNAVTLHDGKEKARDSYGRPDQQSAGSSVAPIAGLDEFSRRPLVRVNPDSVSRVVDADGKPLVVYHGSPSAEINTFDAGKEGANTGAADVDHGLGGFYFTSDPNIADTYARTHEVEFANIAEQELGIKPSRSLPNSTIYPAYLSIKNPLMVDGGAITKAVIDRAQKGGHDGIIKGGTYPEYVAFRPEQIKSAIGNNGDFDPTNPDIRFSRAMPAPSPQPGAWAEPGMTSFDSFVYKLQDKLIDTKRVQAAITKTAGEIEDELNAYQREELYHGRAAKRAQDFLTQELNPMVERLAKDGIELADFEEYLHARHAPEANRVLAERNPNQAMIDAGLEAATLEIEQIELELAATTDPAEIKVLSRRMREAQADLSKWSSVQAYRGTEEDRLMLSGMSDQQAQALMAGLAPELKAKLDASAAKFDAIVDQNRQLMVDYDLEDQETINSWGQLFQHYVPLMREDEGNGVQQGMGTGQGFSIKGREVKSRTGSTRKVVDIVANVAMQRERTITRGEKNRVSQALMGLAALNQNPDFWKLGAPDRKRQYDPATNTVKVVTDPQYKNRENVVVAKVRNSKGNVTEVALTFNERDPRAVRMAAAIKNLEDGQLNWALSNAAKVTRYFASINTQYNPIFGIVNVIRDLQGAAVNLAGTPLKDSKTRVIRNAIVAIGSIYRGARKERKGGENESDWGKLWQEFQEVGGMTGFRDQFRDSQERARAIERTMNPEKWMESAFGKIVTVGGALKKPMTWAQDGGGWVLNWLSDYNLAMENGVRLATYKEGLDKGLTQERAASLAKNLTVNFNRRGSHGMQIGAAYAFFNAAMQGTARMGQAFTTMEDGRLKTLRLSPLGKKVLTGGLMMGIAQAAILAAAGFGDDEPPEFVREKNMILPLGWTGVTSDKGYATIPMPLGLHVIPGIGRHMAEFAMSGGKDPAGRVISIFGMLMDAFNPIGNAGWSAQTFTPTIVDPVVAVFENKDFTGRNIALESRDKNVPGHKLAKDTASSLAKFLSEAINTATGGNDYVSGRLSMTPDQIDYLLGQLTGGVGREALKVEQTIRGAITGEDVPLYKIPLVGRFFGDSSGSAGQSNIFHANIDRLDRAEKEIDGLRKDGRIQESNALRQRSDPYLLAQARAAESQVQRLRRMKRDMVDKGASRESVLEVERKISEAMGRLNRAVESRAK